MSNQTMSLSLDSISMEDILTKSPLKAVNGHHVITGPYARLYRDDIIGQPADMAKLFFVLNNGIVPFEWPRNEAEMKSFVVRQVMQVFDDSGEKSTELCFDVALDYGLIRLVYHEASDRNLYQFRERHDLDLSHDWFCFSCDKLVAKTSEQFIKCGKCFRVYHRKCCLEFGLIREYVCHYCRLIIEKNTIINKKQTKNVDQYRVNRILNFVLSFIKHKMGDKIHKLDFQMEENNYPFLFKQIDLKLIEARLQANHYQSIREFDDDLLFFMHNLHLTQIHVSEAYQSFADLRCYIQREYKEIGKCVDCFERSNDKEFQSANPEWFCLPCDPPHDLVFAKAKGSPHWPAKVIDRDHHQVEVRYFDNNLNKAKLGPAHLFDIDDQDIMARLETNLKMKKSLALLAKCRRLTSAKFGNAADVVVVKSEPRASTSVTISHSNTTPKSVKAKTRVDQSDSILKKQLMSDKSCRQSKKASKQMSNLEDVIERVATSGRKSSKPLTSSTTKRNRKRKCQTEPVLEPDICTDDESVPVLETNTSFNETQETNDIESVDPPVLEIEAQSERDSLVNGTARRRSKRVSEKKGKKVIVCSKQSTEISITPEKSVQQLNAGEEEMESHNSEQTDGSNPVVEPKLVAADKTTKNCSQPNDTNQKPVVDLNEQSANDSLESILNTETLDSKSSSQTKVKDTIFVGFDDIDTKPKSQSQPKQKRELGPEDVRVTYDLRQYNEAANRWADIIKQFKEMKEPISKDDLDEKIAVLEVRHTKQVEAMKDLLTKMERRVKELHFENIDAKCGYWCTICHKPAQYHCCLRLYCSEECRQIHWRKVHRYECTAPQNCD